MSQVLEQHARVIVDLLKAVHSDFNSPQDEEVDAQIVNWGDSALSAYYDRLVEESARYFQSLGLEANPPIQLSAAHALARTAIANGLRTYLWEFRNVPSNQPSRLPSPPATEFNIYNSGHIGVVQTGTASTAFLRSWGSAESAELLAALKELREAILQSQDANASRLELAIEALNRAECELAREHPNSARLTSWLRQVREVADAIGSVQSAVEVVRTVGRAMGLPI